MPLGPYETFGDCLKAQRGKGKDANSARKICGEIEARSEKSNSSIIDPNCTYCENGIEQIRVSVNNIRSQGFDEAKLFNPLVTEEQLNKYAAYNPSKSAKTSRYFIKSFLFSPSINLNDWGVTLDSMSRNIYTFKDMPIVLTRNFKHPDNGKKYDTIENTLEYQEKFRVGHIVDIIKEGSIYYAISEITDEKVKQMFRDNKIPMFVSPAIVHNENSIRKNNWRGVHLAIVDRPAFTVAKATIRGTCEGDYDLCTVQLSTASAIGQIEIDKNDPTNIEGNVTAISYDIDDALDQYLINYKELVKHNIILFNNNSESKSHISMVDNNQESNQNTTKTSILETNKVPSTVTVQTSEFDINMCVANFIERGLDSNTAREICVTAGGSQQGGNGMQGGGNGQQGNGQTQGGQFSEKFYSTISNIINTKNNTIHQLNSKLSNYESQFKEKLGFAIDESSIETIKKWEQQVKTYEVENQRKEYNDYLRLYEKDEEFIKASIDEYIKNNVPIESVKNIYSKRKTLEELNNPKTETETQTSSSNTETKPNEMFNNMKENNGFSVETQDNRMIQKATASTNDNKNRPRSKSNVMIDFLSPKMIENTSNNTNGVNN
jgi:hypothetical protein